MLENAMLRHADDRTDVLQPWKTVARKRGRALFLSGPIGWWIERDLLDLTKLSNGNIYNGVTNAGWIFEFFGKGEEDAQTG